MNEYQTGMLVGAALMLAAVCAVRWLDARRTVRINTAWFKQRQKELQ